jgi:hypothetical protein
VSKGSGSWWRRTLQAVGAGFLWTAIGLLSLAGIALVGVWAWILVMGAFVWSHDDDAKPEASPSPTATTTRIMWAPAYAQCADGWNSPLIGRSGACSHHGGVVYYYRSTAGDLITSCPPRYQPKTLEEARALIDARTGQVNCDFSDPDFSRPGM